MASERYASMHFHDEATFSLFFLILVPCNTDIDAAEGSAGHQKYTCPVRLGVGKGKTHFCHGSICLCPSNSVASHSPY